jgi:hypothetical protein
MKTTVDIPDSLLRQAKARAALKGTSMRDFFVQAIEARLDAEQKRPRKPHGWRAVFGKAPKGSAAEVQATIDEEFGKIDPDDWR